ncbi:hypothetical protein Sjap_005947 [Stephania japonica]|uniref:Uncharacterized protein n=1 Tax=Stephania japonica TaxID=461633 RepID=A0AAP0K6N3_9MAGN
MVTTGAMSSEPRGLTEMQSSRVVSMPTQVYTMHPQPAMRSVASVFSSNGENVMNLAGMSSQVPEMAAMSSRHPVYAQTPPQDLGIVPQMTQQGSQSTGMAMPAQDPDVFTYPSASPQFLGMSPISTQLYGGSAIQGAFVKNSNHNKGTDGQYNNGHGRGNFNVRGGFKGQRGKG